MYFTLKKRIAYSKKYRIPKTIIKNNSEFKVIFFVNLELGGFLKYKNNITINQKKNKTNHPIIKARIKSFVI